jgi:hypothetical protein
VTPGAGITFAYDQSTGVLSVTIDNTTPVVAGEATATISEVHFNLPPGAVTGAVLANQTGAGGATPAFTLSFDADTAAAPNPNGAGCLGNFNVTLSGGAIANAAAWTLGNFGLAGAGNSFCIPVNVPNNPQLSGFTFHVVNITYNALNVVDYSFSAPLEIVIN